MAPGMHMPLALQVEVAVTLPLIPIQAAGAQTVPAG